MKQISCIPTILVLLFISSLSYSQTNTWVKVSDSGAGYRSTFALTYDPAADHFIMTLGRFGSTSNLTGPYIDQAFSFLRGRWFNLLPSPDLYGVWVDSFGVALPTSPGNMTYQWPGRMFTTASNAGTTYLRPTIYASPTYNFYQSMAYNPNDRCTYYIWGNNFARYNNATRVWDTLPKPWRPASSWKWGNIVHDGLNNELVLFGGGNVDTLGGHYGTRVYSFASGAWRLLDLSVQPLPRANGSMVYDEKNKVIVLFGGDHLDSLFSDTWVYDCATRTWEKKNPPVSPSARMGHSLLYLPKSGSVVLLGGANYTATIAYMAPQYKTVTPYQIWKYNLVSDQWTLVKQFGTGENVPQPYSSLSQKSAADALDNILLVDSKGATWKLACDPTVVDAAGATALGVAPNTSMRRSGAGWIPEWFTNGVATPDTAATEAALRALPANVWTKLTPPRNHGCNFDWGRTIYVPEHDVILSWNGGHSAYPGNQVLQYAVPENRVTVGYDAELLLEDCYTSNAYPRYFTFGGRPFMAVHTYQEYAYDDNLHRMLIIHDRTYLYDPIRKDFDSARIPIHPEISFIHNESGLFPAPAATYCWSNSKFFALDSGTRVWRKLPVTGNSPDFDADNSGACFDATRNRLWLYKSGEMFALNLVSNTVDTFQALNSRPGVRPRREMVYVKSVDRVFFPAISTTQMLSYNCAENKWEAPAISLGSGTTFYHVDASSPNVGLMYDEKRKLFYIGNDGTLWLVMNPAGFAGLEESATLSRPGALVLKFANPFMPGAVLRINGDGDETRVAISNIRGQQIAGFTINTRVHNGHEVPWRAMDPAGKQLPAGVYYVKAVSSSGCSVKKPLVLLR